MAHKMGWEQKLYRNTGSFGSPTWDLVTNCRDLTLTGSASKNDASTRLSRVKTYAAGQIDLGFNFQMVYDPADTDLTAIRTAFYAQTALDLMDLDGLAATSGSLGVRAVCQIFSMEKGEPIDGIATYDIEAAPTYDSTNGGASLVTSNGTPSYAAI